MKEKIFVSILCFLQPVLAAIPFLETVDIGTKVFSFILSAVIGFFVVRHYISQYELYRIDKEIKKRQLADLEKRDSDE